MSATNDLESGIMLLLFNNTNIANIGDATGLRGSTSAGNFQISLHTADPGEAGTQVTSETSYTGYGRVAVARSAGGFTVSGTAPTQAANAATITFGQCTAGSATLTHVGVGQNSSGAGAMWLKGALTSSLAVSVNIQPSFSAGALVFTVD